MPEVLTVDGEFADDNWTVLDDDAPLPAGARVIVSLDRWQTQRAALTEQASAVGVQLDNTEDVEALGADTFDGLALVALQFPAFTDGRAYSQARLLRERLGFDGTIRACGEVLHDQLFYMARCGFDDFEAPLNLDRARARDALRTFSLAYQPTASGPRLQRAGSLA